MFRLTGKSIRARFDGKWIKGKWIRAKEARFTIYQLNYEEDGVYGLYDENHTCKGTLSYERIAYNTSPENPIWELFDEKSDI